MTISARTVQDPRTRVIDEGLRAFLPDASVEPMTIHRAMHAAIFGAGTRAHSRLVLAVASASRARPCDDPELELVLRSACAVEFVHCASLTWGEISCFDDGDHVRRRGVVEAQFGLPLAILASHALIARAFEIVAAGPIHLHRRALRLSVDLARAASGQFGIVGAQCPDRLLSAGASAVIVNRYQQMKAPALFRVAAEMGATAAGHPSPAAWGDVGGSIGLALQAAVEDDAPRGVQVTRVGALSKPELPTTRRSAASASGGVEAREQIDRILAGTTGLAVDPTAIQELVEDLFTASPLPRSSVRRPTAVVA